MLIASLGLDSFGLSVDMLGQHTVPQQSPSLTHPPDLRTIRAEQEVIDLDSDSDIDDFHNDLRTAMANSLRPSARHLAARAAVGTSRDHGATTPPNLEVKVTEATPTRIDRSAKGKAVEGTNEC